MNKSMTNKKAGLRSPASGGKKESSEKGLRGTKAKLPSC